MKKSLSIKIISLVAIICSISSLMLVSAADYTAIAPKPPTDITAGGIFVTELGKNLEDSSDDTVLYSKAADEKMYPASLTKIMTAIVVLKNIPTQDLVSKTATMTAEISKELAKSGASTAGLKVGEEVTYKDLMYAMLLPSGADAALLLADETFKGDRDKFINQMNETAAELKLQNTHFTNVIGLHDANMFSTPRDLAIIAEYAMYNMPSSAFFREVVNTKSYEIKTNLHPSGLVVKTTNMLLQNNTPNINGVKTGTTKEAGECLISSYSDENMNLIMVVLKSTQGKVASKQAYTDTKNLLSYIKTNFSVLTDFKKIAPFKADVSLASDGNGGKSFDFIPTGDVHLVIPKGMEEKITFESVNKLNLIAPLKAKNTNIDAKIMLDGIEIGKTNLINEKDINIGILYIFAGVAIAITIIVIIIIVIVVLSDTSGKRKRKKRRKA